MSRIGIKPITVPAGVTVDVDGANAITVKGSLGTITRTLHPRMTVKVDGAVINVERPTDDPSDKALHGLTRTLVANMVEGVSKGYSKKLEIVGVGYKAAKNGKNLVLDLGYSHDVIFEEKDGISFDVPDANTVIVKGISKEMVGEIAAQIRGKRPPEPYLGKGVKYTGEFIRRKTGKAGK